MHNAEVVHGSQLVVATNNSTESGMKVVDDDHQHRAAIKPIYSDLF